MANDQALLADDFNPEPSFDQVYEIFRQKLLKSEVLDWNASTPREKQVLYAHMGCGLAKFDIQNERRVVKRTALSQHPLLNALVQLFTMMSCGYTRVTL
jgi:hypothetical protein